MSFISRRLSNLLYLYMRVIGARAFRSNWSWHDRFARRKHLTGRCDGRTFNVMAFKLSSTMPIGARVLLLLCPLLTALYPAAAHPAESGDFAGLVGISGGRKMYLECRGSGSPTVVLIAGLKGSAEDWNIADKQAPDGICRGRQVYPGVCLRPPRNAGR
jgi:hypothetical protein